MMIPNLATYYSSFAFHLPAAEEVSIVVPVGAIKGSDMYSGSAAMRGPRNQPIRTVGVVAIKVSSHRSSVRRFEAQKGSRSGKWQKMTKIAPFVAPTGQGKHLLPTLSGKA